EFRRRLYYLRVIMEEDSRLMEELDRARSMHQETVESIEEKVRTISRLEEEEAERLAGLNADQEEKVLLLMKVHKEKEFYETAVKELQAAAEELRKTITDLDSKSEWPEKLTSDFAQHKGSLPKPFDGKVTRSSSNADSGLASKGVFIEGSKGGKVSAVYDGRVEYSGWLKGYGRIVIINHGSRYFSVSAQLSEILCRKGQVVEQGEVIGLAGRIESLSAPGVYFELRKAGEPMDPLAWLKAH
ncbi:MAG: murein hydrolase activator EnvC family protein, partial [Desulfobacteraceae bacterium]